MLGKLVVAASVATVVMGDMIENKCDPDYDCKFKEFSPSNHLFEFDFSHLCEGRDYNVSSGDRDYFFKICGVTENHCNPPGYTSEYRYGAAIQYFGERPPCNGSDNSTMCPSPNGGYECCTRDCEVLGIGTPIWSLVDPNNPATGGVMLTFTGVDPSYNDPFPQCPYNKERQGYFRDINFVMHCNPGEVGTLKVIDMQEGPPCNYTITLHTNAACGCAPRCNGRLCGSDGCGGFCSGATLAGECPFEEVCLNNGTCCRPDCTHRECGDNGCGGSCGTCGPAETCSTNMQVCIPAQQYMPAANAVYTVDKGGLAGSFFGGIIVSLAISGVVFWFFGGGKQRFDAWRFGSAVGDSASQSGLLGSRPAAATTTSTSAPAPSAPSGYGSYGSYGT